VRVPGFFDFPEVVLPPPVLCYRAPHRKTEQSFSKGNLMEIPYKPRPNLQKTTFHTKPTPEAFSHRLQQPDFAFAKFANGLPISMQN